MSLAELEQDLTNAWASFYTEAISIIDGGDSAISWGRYVIDLENECYDLERAMLEVSV